MAITRCPYCHAIIDEMDKYCNNCGTQLLFPEDDVLEEEIPGEKIIDAETEEKDYTIDEPEEEKIEYVVGDEGVESGEGEKSIEDIVEEFKEPDDETRALTTESLETEEVILVDEIESEEAKEDTGTTEVSADQDEERYPIKSVSGEPEEKHVEPPVSEIEEPAEEPVVKPSFEEPPVEERFEEHADEPREEEVVTEGGEPTGEREAETEPDPVAQEKKISAAEEPAADTGEEIEQAEEEIETKEMEEEGEEPPIEQVKEEDVYEPVVEPKPNVETGLDTEKDIMAVEEAPGEAEREEAELPTGEEREADLERELERVEREVETKEMAVETIRESEKAQEGELRVEREEEEAKVAPADEHESERKIESEVREETDSVEHFDVDARRVPEKGEEEIESKEMEEEVLAEPGVETEEVPLPIEEEFVEDEVELTDVREEEGELEPRTAEEGGESVEEPSVEIEEPATEAEEPALEKEMATKEETATSEMEESKSTPSFDTWELDRMGRTVDLGKEKVDEFLESKAEPEDEKNEPPHSEKKETGGTLPPWADEMKDAPPSETDDVYEVAEGRDEGDHVEAPETKGAPARTLEDTEVPLEIDEEEDIPRPSTTDSGIGIPERVSQATLPFDLEDLRKEEGVEMETGEGDWAEDARPVPHAAAREEEIPSVEGTRPQKPAPFRDLREEYARPTFHFSAFLRAKGMDCLFVAFFWLVCVWLAAGSMGTSIFRLFSEALGLLLALFAALLALYFFLFQFFLGETLGDRLFRKEE